MLRVCTKTLPLSLTPEIEFRIRGLQLSATGGYCVASSINTTHSTHIAHTQKKGAICGAARVQEGVTQKESERFSDLCSRFSLYERYFLSTAVVALLLLRLLFLAALRDLLLSTPTPKPSPLFFFCMMMMMVLSA